MFIVLCLHVAIPIVLALLPFARNRWFFEAVESPRTARVGERLLTIWVGLWILLPIALGLLGLGGWLLLYAPIFLVGVVGGIIGDVLP